MCLVRPSRSFPFEENKSARGQNVADWIFAFFHLFLLLGAVIYAFYSLFVHGNVLRFGLLVACLIIYYFIVLRKPVLKEIERKRKLKSGGDQK